MITTHTTDIFLQKPHFIRHQTDVSKRGETNLTHTTTTIKRKTPFVIFTTSTNKLKDPLLTHSSDIFLRSSNTPPTILGVQSEEFSIYPEFSKNAPLYIDIGGGLSSIVGIPRIPTWNTLGRPVKPKRGTYGLNTETKRLEVWNGSFWFSTILGTL